MIRVVILGANSHLAKGLIQRFAVMDNAELFLFSRKKEYLAHFLASNNWEVSGNHEYSDGLPDSPHLIINCVGFGKVSTVDKAGISLFSVFEEFDNLCLDYLSRNPEAAYIYFSSGAIYGSDLNNPANEESISTYSPNHVGLKDFYRIIKLYTETKHQAYSGYRIWDVRVFNYFSRYIDLSAGMLITGIVNSLLNKVSFVTSADDIVRDFIHPDDLFSLILSIEKSNQTNSRVDVYSKAPLKKFDLLEKLKKKYNLEYKIDDDFTGKTPTGSKNIYYSENREAERLLSFAPKFTSFDAIDDEISYILPK